MTLEKFLSLPETNPYSELIDGEVCQKAMGKETHSSAQGALVLLFGTAPALRGGRCYPELGFNFPTSLEANHRVPDFSFYKPGRPRPSHPYPLADEMPDLVAEIRSEGQTRGSQERRLAFLRANGVLCTLLVDPQEQSVTVHELGREWVAYAGDVVTLESLRGFSFQVSVLFE